VANNGLAVIILFGKSAGGYNDFVMEACRFR
jgi:hypothetical protein